MNRDKHYEKRMIVNKYSNIPPFNLKHPNHTSDLSNNILDNPEANCKNCCKKRHKQLKNSILRPNTKFDNYELEKDVFSDNKVILKVIQNFQKATPSKESNTVEMTENDSIETLYRKGSNIKLGKNIPGHKLMKSLLQNFDSDCDRGLVHQSRRKRNSPKRSSLKYKRPTKKQTFHKSKPINSNFDEAYDTKTDALSRDIYSKIDKNTSTTGLVWPPRSIEVIRYYTKNSCQKSPYSNEQKCSSNSTAKCNLKSGKNDSSRINVHNKKCDDHPMTENKNDDSNRHPRHLVKDQANKRDSISQNKNNKLLPKKLQIKQKSFVQMQVEKLNNAIGSGDGTKIPITKGNLNLTRNKEKSNHIGMMNAARNNVPWIRESSQQDNDQNWSEASEDYPSSTVVTFPKETKMVMYQHLNERRQPIVLSKFTKIENFKPAMSSKITELKSDEECFCNHQHECHKAKESPNIPDTILARKCMGNSKLKFPMPCKKNLLCDKGDHHQGPCGYTHNTLNKIVY